MKRYRVLKPYSWTERDNGPEIRGRPGDLAILPAVVAVGAPEGTFELWPGEVGYAAPAPEMPAEATPEAAQAGKTNPAPEQPTAPSPPPAPRKRVPKASAVKPKRH